MSSTPQLDTTSDRRAHTGQARVAPPEPIADHPLTGVVNIAHERVQRGLDTVRSVTRRAVAGRTQPLVDPDTLGELARDDLSESLIVLLGRPVVLELHIARLQNRLRGATPEDRFRTFIDDLAHPAAAKALLDEYPVLARQIELRVDHWVAATCEFVYRLSHDWDDIVATFAPGSSPGQLVGLQTGSGDKHRRGRSVVIARFRSGFQLVYKPRSLAVDTHFQQFLGWLNQHGADPAFRTITVLERGDYGWSESVTAHDCSSPAQVERFYRRQGGYLAVLFALCAVDFHHENLIAAGEHPVLVDLEALFHPELFDRGSDAAAGLGRSVLATGLLPWRIVPAGRTEGIDVSAMGAIEGAQWPSEVPRWERAGTDAMRMGRARSTAVSGAEHRPHLHGRPADPAEHVHAVSDGFSAIYDLLVRHRDELLAGNGPVARFTHDEVRVIVRPTQTYAKLLHASLHPDLLRDPGERDRLLDRLWGQADTLALLRHVVPAERADLAAGDIPLFTTRPSSRDLWTSRGERLADVLERSGLELVSERLGTLGQGDLNRQRWFIQASFASLDRSAAPGDGPKPVVGPGGPSASHSGPSPERLLAHATAIGDRLLDAAYRSDAGCSWVGLALNREDRWTPAPLGSNLYDGLAGVALFLAHLGAVTGQPRFSDAAAATLGTMRDSAEIDRVLDIGVGAFTGWAGPLYALTHVAALWRRPDLFAQAEALLDEIEPLIGSDDAFDVVGGVAGCALALLSLYRCLSSRRVLDAAVLCGRRLVAGATPMVHGIAWSSPVSRGAPLTGLSHGAAGVALALHELSVVTGDAGFRSAASDGLAYERSLYSSEARNWPDLRRLPEATGARVNESGFMTSFCHGAPGIGLARTRMLRTVDDPFVRREVDIAVHTTITHGWGSNHSLCHGDLGNVDLLIEARRVLGDGGGTDDLVRASAAVVNDMERNGWRCANPAAIESPELMTGLSGIGYGLLRLAAPHQVPSVLLLDAPAGSYGDGRGAARR